MRWLVLLSMTLVCSSACRSGGDAACELPQEGIWELESDHLGTRGHRAHLEVDGLQCGFYFTEFEPELPEAIDGGQIDAKRVNLSGDAYWSTCTGSLTMQGAMMSGECDDGTPFHFMHDAPGEAGHVHGG